MTTSFRAPRGVRSLAAVVSLVFAIGATWAGCAAGTEPQSTGGGAGGGGAKCPGATACGEVCANLDFDPAHCGACDKACGEGQYCSNGQCGLGCFGGSTQCGDRCVDLEVDPAHCGGCGAKCAAGLVCSLATCAVECLGGSQKCGDQCVDTQNDPKNCGGCTDSCEAGEVCQNGTCALDCVGSSTKCGDKCVDLDSHPAHCGACEQPCGTGQLCNGGTCGLACLGGTSKCGNACVDTKNDPKNCGGCNLQCALGEACYEGKCGLCIDGLTQCGAVCADLVLDPNHCGFCGNACPGEEVCSGSACAASCGGGLSKCGKHCVDFQSDPKNCGGCGVTCGLGASCAQGACVECDSATTDCDGDGWLVADGDCCDKPGLCGAEPALVNPGAIEVVGNGIDDNCNGKTDLFDLEDTLPCDANLASDSSNAVDYARAIGICRMTEENPALPQAKNWGLLSAKLLRADGSPLGDTRARSIRQGFGSINPPSVEGQSVIVLSSGIASDATQANPGPNGGAPGGFNVSTTHNPSSAVNIQSAGSLHSVSDWYATPNPPLKPANGLPDSPGCFSSNIQTANDSVMLVLRMRAPTNAKAFSFNSYFFSAEYPEFVCTSFNDQFIALVDTPTGVPSPLANPIDKNLMTYTKGDQQWPIGINIAKGTSLFAVCESQSDNSSCWDPDVDVTSCSLGASQLAGTGFEKPQLDSCTVGGGTFWLTTAGNVIPGEVVELRIAIWDVGDSAYDSLTVIDGFQWLANATLPGTGN